MMCTHIRIENIFREQKNARNSALKVLSYAMNNLDGKENCEEFGKFE
jgi:hypothetical protein